MSTRAITVYESLVASGIPESKARVAAEAIDRDSADKVAASEAKSAAQFVPKDEYARRMENTPARDEVDRKFDSILAEIRGIRAEMREDKAELRREIRFNNRVTLGLLIVLTVLTVKIVIGF